ncbi:MAG: alpha/beta fold hydrolase [Streptosporangiaceae bacterium]
MLGYAEYGPAAGPPLFLFHGLPGSRLAVPEMWPEDPVAVRVIAPDRPGVGSSAFQPGRRLTDWAADIGQLADSLGMERFLVAGFSGGGPHALAVAHSLPDRVIAAGSISGGAAVRGDAARTPPGSCFVMIKKNAGPRACPAYASAQAGPALPIGPGRRRMGGPGPGLAALPDG